MTWRFRMAMRLVHWRNSLLKILSSTYRESSELQYQLQSERAEHARSKALLHNAEQDLAEARSQIQSLTISAQAAAADAAKLRQERDTAREQSIEYLDRLSKQHQPMMDWIAQGCPRHPIYGAGPQLVQQQQPESTAPLGGVHGRRLASQITRETIEQMRKNLEEHNLPEKDEVAV